MKGLTAAAAQSGTEQRKQSTGRAEAAHTAQQAAQQAAWQRSDSRRDGPALAVLPQPGVPGRRLHHRGRRLAAALSHDAKVSASARQTQLDVGSSFFPPCTTTLITVCDCPLPPTPSPFKWASTAHVVFGSGSGHGAGQGVRDLASQSKTTTNTHFDFPRGRAASAKLRSGVAPWRNSSASVVAAFRTLCRGRGRAASAAHAHTHSITLRARRGW